MSLIFLIAFIFGVSCGSFLITAVFRLRGNQSLWGRSKCDHCNKTLGIKELIPILGFFTAQRKCKNCKNKISFLYPLVELAFGMLFVFVAYMRIKYGGASVPSFIVRDWYIVWMLGFIFLFDLLFLEVEDKLVVPAVFTVFIISGVFHWQTWTSMTLGALVGGGFFLIQYLASRGSWVGVGDILVGFFMGVILGFPLTIVGLLISYLIGGAMSSVFLILKKNKPGDKVPMGVYLSLGIFLTMFWGEHLFGWYMSFL